MPVTDVTTDAEALTMTLTAEFAAPVERLWNAFTDPGQLERFWGPPGWPASFPRFDFTVGGRAVYAMTSPRGEKSFGSWEFSMSRAPAVVKSCPVRDAACQLAPSGTSTTAASASMATRGRSRLVSEASPTPASSPHSENVHMKK